MYNAFRDTVPLHCPQIPGSSGGPQGGGPRQGHRHCQHREQRGWSQPAAAAGVRPLRPPAPHHRRQEDRGGHTEGHGGPLLRPLGRHQGGVRVSRESSLILKRNEIIKNPNIKSY